MQTSPRSAMASYTFLKLALVHGAALGLGALIASACISVDYPSVAFICNPRLDDACPDGYLCCSDDPSPYFSGINNNQSARGMCVEEGFISVTEQHPMWPGCPMPCNPLWTQNDINTLCSPTGAPGAFVCCETVPIGDSDCVQDPELGTPEQTTIYRPVLITDATDRDPPLSGWTTEHETNQDPNGTYCNRSTNPQDCISRLTVANQRGFCFPQTIGCPARDPTYVDACNRLNASLGNPTWQEAS